MGILEANKNNNYELIPPDGGFAYIINFGVMTMLTFTIVPVSSFALIFGPLISKYHDETSATTLVTSIYITVLHSTGLLAHLFLQKLSYRKVALLGAIVYICGSFSLIFATNLHYVIISYGVIQGLGAGLIMPPALTAVNDYFDRKKSLAIATGNTVTAAVNIVYPGFTKILLDKYGFRGTQAIFSAMSLHILFGALTLQPLKWHAKRKLKLEDVTEASSSGSNEVVVPTEAESQQLLQDNANTRSPYDSKLSKSFTSLASTISYPNCKKEQKSSWKSLVDFSILKDGYYWNLALGLALSVISEMNFMAILPILLFNIGFTKSDVTLAMTVFFTSDLATRLLFILVTAFCVFRVRQVFLINILLTIVLRIAFTATTSFWFIVILTALIGCSRCLIIVPMPMVLAESYSEKFAGAFSFYMVFNGLLSVIVGALTGLAKYKSGSDVMVVHVLTAICLICAISWTIELTYKNLKSKRKEPNMS